MAGKDSSVMGRVGHRCSLVTPMSPEFRLRCMQAAAKDGLLLSQFVRRELERAVKRMEKRASSGQGGVA